MKDSRKRNELLDRIGCPSDAKSTLQLLDSVDVALLGVCTQKPVLVEGKPAVGETALVGGLRKSRGRLLQKGYNSEQTATPPHCRTTLGHGRL